MEQQFVASNKSLRGTLMSKLTIMRYNGISGIIQQIMEMSNVVNQLNALKMSISKYFLVQFILNPLPLEYGLYKISYKTHKNKKTIHKLSTLCT